jgi:hypothetical protein
MHEFEHCFFVEGVNSSEMEGYITSSICNPSAEVTQKEEEDCFRANFEGMQSMHIFT